jgi:uncharacterized protein
MGLNLSNVKTPGVYIDEVSLLPPSVAGVETGIPAFIGYTRSIQSGTGENLKLKPKKISSLRQYIDLYGLPQAEDDGLSVTIKDFMTRDGSSIIRSEKQPNFTSSTPSKHNMYYAMELYYMNGGGPCYVISVGAYTGTVLDADLLEGLKALKMEDEPTMIVFPEAIHLTSVNAANLYKQALDQAALLKDRFVIIDVPQNDTKPEDIEQGDIKKFRDGSLGDNVKFGAAYYPHLMTTIDYNYLGQEDKVTIVHKKVAPDLVETPGEHDGKKMNAFSVTSAMYNELKDLLSQVPMKMPPSPAIAGIYAQTDASRGVWKSPANVGVGAVVGPAIAIDDAIQASMNVDSNTGRSINAIRAITGRGTVVWGARTLDGNSNEWRYISVRRFFNFVEESVKKACARFVFEPNDANTWVRVRAMVENFLIVQWRQGALQGAKPEDAFTVRVGLNQTMTPDDVLNGFMIIEIGMAVVRPTEFIILRFSHKMMVS